jgi:hypothetical protein
MLPRRFNAKLAIPWNSETPACCASPGDEFIIDNMQDDRHGPQTVTRVQLHEQLLLEELELELLDDELDELLEEELELELLDDELDELLEEELELLELLDDELDRGELLEELDRDELLDELEREELELLELLGDELELGKTPDELELDELLDDELELAMFDLHNRHDALNQFNRIIRGEWGY